ncbi:MAG: hypothetical protein JWP48_3631 [Actinoallomurus sp.]|jgi:hypothetical protein|nr:hypothetical protein [Actinoallomurus sp.]
MAGPRLGSYGVLAGDDGDTLLHFPQVWRAAAEAMFAGSAETPPAAGLISAHFYVSVERSRVFNYALWTGPRKHTGTPSRAVHHNLSSGSACPHSRIRTTAHRPKPMRPSSAAQTRARATKRSINQHEVGVVTRLQVQHRMGDMPGVDQES